MATFFAVDLLARGLLATPRYSARWLAHPEFSRPVEEFLDPQASGMVHAIEELNENGPFKREA